MRDSEAEQQDYWADDARVGAAVSSSEDAEGPRAFAEKRPAQYRGR